MARKKKLPKGLQEFEGSLHDLEYASKLLPRLLDLPENDLSEHLSDFRRAMSQVKLAEEVAKKARNLARQEALLMWRDALNGWTIEEIEEATGYKDE